MNTAEMELNREIVSEADWLIARRDLLTRERNSRVNGTRLVPPAANCRW